MEFALTCFNDFNNLFMDALADLRDILQLLFIPLNNRPQALRQTADYKRGIPVRAHPERILVLYLQQVCYVFKDFCDVRVFHRNTVSKYHSVRAKPQNSRNLYFDTLIL